MENEPPKNNAAVQLGKLGGKASARVRSDAKSAASRSNGKKGGRPRGALSKSKKGNPIE
jgi:hypothetical protein